MPKSNTPASGKVNKHGIIGISKWGIIEWKNSRWEFGGYCMTREDARRVVKSRSTYQAVKVVHLTGTVSYTLAK